MAPSIRDTHFRDNDETKPYSKHRVTEKIVSRPEEWLYGNKKALRSVRRGLSQARSGKLVKAPEDYRKHT